MEVAQILNGVSLPSTPSTAMFASSTGLSIMIHSGSSTVYIIDSGATHHMTPDKSMFSHCISHFKCTSVMPQMEHLCLQIALILLFYIIGLSQMSFMCRIFLLTFFLLVNLLIWE